MLGMHSYPSRLEVVLGHPEVVVSQPVHVLGQGEAGFEGRGQVLVGVPPIVYRRSLEPDVLHVHMPRVKAPESRDHSLPPFHVLRMVIIWAGPKPDYPSPPARVRRGRIARPARDGMPHQRRQQRHRD